MDSLMRLHLVYHPNKIATIVFGLGLVRLLGTLVPPDRHCWLKLCFELQE